MKKTAISTPAEAWQRCRQEDLPRAFYAYKDGRSQRAVTFRLKDFADLQAEVPKSGDFQFVVHLGLHPDRLGKGIGKKPAFTLFIQVVRKGAGYGNKGYELAWTAKSRFSKGLEQGPTSGLNAIPAASAYLFVHSWLETPEVYLSDPFLAATRNLGERVKAYLFAPAESRSIANDLGKGATGLDIHLGNGMAVWQHPFSFRPVIEVKRTLGKDYAPASDQLPRNTSGMTNDEGDSFYDFGYPDPPSKPGD